MRSKPRFTAYPVRDPLFRERTLGNIKMFRLLLAGRLTDASLREFVYLDLTQLAYRYFAHSVPAFASGLMITSLSRF